MSYKSWNGVRELVLLPDTVDGLNSRAFTCPRGARSVSIFIPALVGVATTVKLQALTPPEQDNVTEAWVDITVFDLTDGTFEALDAMPESTLVTLPTTALGGGGVYRFVASAAQTGAVDAETITLLWNILP